MRKKFSSTTNRRAFALVLAIGAMAFMVLLTLTLSSVVSAKIRVLNAQKQSRQARANALLGMSVAVSDLQRTLGKDNAISFPASIFDADPETPIVESVRTPYAIGVYKIDKNTYSKTPLEIQEEQRAAIDDIKNANDSENVTWLISGEKKMSNPIIQSPDELSDDAVTLAKFKSLTDYPAIFGDKISSDLKSEDVEVRAGKVTLQTDGQTQSGAYAFWISDESLKAKINLTRPEKYLNKSTEAASKSEAPSDSRVPQISNLSFIDELQDIGINPFLSDYNEDNAKKIARINVLNELALVSPDYEKWAKNNLGDFTASSQGLPVDVTQGRLKEDLSVYLQKGLGLDDKTPIVRGSQKDIDYTGTNFGIKNFNEGLPTFGLLKDFATLAENKTQFSDSVAPQARVIDTNKNIQHGIYPLVKTIKFVMMPAFSFIQQKGQNAYEIKTTDSPTVGLSIMFWPRIVLWNPHNVALEASDYIIRVYMPYKIYIGPKNSYFRFFTRWREYTVDEAGKEIKGDIKKVAWRSQQFMRDDGYFGYFLKQKSDNGMPCLTFQVKNLAMRPGESIELNIKSSGGMQTYKDVDINSLGSSDNLLEAGSITAQDGPNTNCIALEKKCIKIDTTYTFKITSVSSYGTDMDTKDLTFENNYWKSSDGKRIYKPMSHEIAKNSSNIQNKTPDPYFELPNIEDESNANYRGWKILLSSKSNKIPNRCGYELFTNKNGLQRLVKDDTTEWENQSQPGLLSTTRKQAYGNGQVTLELGNILQYKFSHDEKDGNYPKSRLIINNENVLFDSDLGDNDVKRNGNIVYLTIDEVNRSDLFYSNGNLMQGIKLQNLYSTSARIFTSSNMLASGLKSGDVNSISQANDPSVIKRPGGKLEIYFGVGRRFSGAGSASYDVFFGKQAWNGYIPGTFSYKNGTEIDSLKPTTNNLKSKYAAGAGDSHSNRFGELSFLSGPYVSYYDWIACAPFDYPRSKFDLMSLGVFNHANLSPHIWQPTFPFAQSYASPYLDRENIIEDKVLNENELLDISYVLNASMWDRFFLSSIPQDDMPQEINAGMRLPNTRLFLTSTPEDKSNLYNSAEAFRQAAKYITIDGAFNVNSTSYEAWRAFLGGMLGTKKKTSVDGYINDKSQDSKNSDDLKMPNPGDIYPLTTPHDGKYSWIDTIVGRTVSESEIDLLAREIVAEVKRRAPFFSLSDFVNRRLYKYETGEDEEAVNIRYQSLMGTLAAAIRRAELNDSRKPSFFNDKSFDDRVSYIDSSNGESFVFTTKYVTAFDNYNKGNIKRDLGSEVKKAEKQYIEQAICSPILKNDWANQLICLPGLLSQADILQQIGSVIAVRGDTFLVRAYGEAINPMTGTSSKAYCEAVVQRTTETVEPNDNQIAPESEFGRKFKVVSFRWLTPAEI